MPKGIPIPDITKIQLFSHISCAVASKVGRLMRLSNVEKITSAILPLASNIL